MLTMAWRRSPARGRRPAEPPPEVQVSVVYSRRGRTVRRRIAHSMALNRGRVVAACAVALVAGTVILAAAVLEGRSAGGASAAGAAELRNPGPAGVAAAYRYPANCLSVSFAPAARSYARARLDRASPCWRYGVWVTAVFHREDGIWHQVLDAASYSCPVRSIPRLVERQLGICR